MPAPLTVIFYRLLPGIPVPSHDDRKHTSSYRVQLAWYSLHLVFSSLHKSIPPSLEVGVTVLQNPSNVWWMQLQAPVVARTQSGGRIAARRRDDRLGHGDGAVGRRAGADVAGASGRRVLRAGRVGVAQLRPDAVNVAGLAGKGDPVLGPGTIRVAHTEQERVAKKKLVQATEIYVKMVKKMKEQ